MIPITARGIVSAVLIATTSIVAGWRVYLRADASDAPIVGDQPEYSSMG